jgi:hypothetical protein
MFRSRRPSNHTYSVKKEHYVKHELPKTDKSFIRRLSDLRDKMCGLHGLWKYPQYFCLSCPMIHYSLEMARDHAISHDKSLLSNLEAFRTSMNYKGPLCDLCNDFIIHKNTDQSAHLKYCGDYETICKECNQDYKRPQWLQCHVDQNPHCRAKKKARESQQSDTNTTQALLPRAEELK